MKSPLVTIVILNWNGKEHLVDCLDSVRHTSYEPIEILFVDNGSSDGSVELVRRTYRDVGLVENGLNLGYADGNNRGILHAKGKYVVTLNNDMVVEPTWLDKPIELLEKDRLLGLVSCRQMNYYDRSLIDSLFHCPAPDLTFWRVGHGDGFKRDSWHNETGYVIAPNGGSAIYRKDMFDQLGGFDKTFFAYHDETDLSMRAFLAGWKCLYVPGSVVYHKDSASFKKNRGSAIYFHARNKLWFMTKYFPTSLILSHAGGIVHEELRIIKRAFFVDKTPVSYVKARVDGIAGIARYGGLRKKYIPEFRRKFLEYRRYEKERIILEK